MNELKQKIKAFTKARPYLGQQVYWVVAITIMSILSRLFITKDLALITPTIIYGAGLVMTNMAAKNDMCDFYRNVGIAAGSISGALLVGSIALYRINHKILFAKSLGASLGALLVAYTMYKLEKRAQKRRNPHENS